MKRRDFLQGVAAAGAVAISPTQGISDTAPGRVEQSAQSHPFPLALDEDATHRELLHVENDHLSFTLFGDARASIDDRKNGAQWRMGPVALQEESEIDLGQVWLRTERSICEQYPGRFVGQREGNNVRFWLRGRENHVKGSFLIHISLDGPWLEYRLLEVDEQLPSLSFPPAIESASLVLPMHVGRWIRKSVANRFVYPFFSHLNMRWFGGLNQGNGWLAVFPEANFIDSGVMVTEMAAAPVWLKQLGRWSEPRAVRYRFIAGSYVELALSYREWAVSHGIHRSLSEKLKSTPALANLTQGRLVSMLEATALHGKGYDENLLRSTGADVLYAPGLTSKDDIAAVTRSVDRPVNVLMGMQGVQLSQAELSSIGVKRISVGSALSRAALGAFLRAAKEMHDHGTFTFAREAVSFKEISSIV